ncbi:MAG: translesion error-prone DNA polymerase V autoproteolytic subunit [Lactobacillales bacterium]|jgi:DNA polymerase V|nr:translesion error-prone DNA polymerase V autoproteolytic subunit [Lactobacillales bacterium]
MTSTILTLFGADTSTPLALPFADGGIRAGFPSPAQDYLETSIDLNRELITHPASTFFGRVSGDSMKNAGLADGDLLVIDKSLAPKTGDIAVCFIDGEFTVKFIKKEKNALFLVPANESYPILKITPDNDFLIWGIVTHSIKSHKRAR